jgi:hypothetical protein
MLFWPLTGAFESIRGFIADGLALRQRVTVHGMVERLDSDLRQLRTLLA